MRNLLLFPTVFVTLLASGQQGDKRDSGAQTQSMECHLTSPETIDRLAPSLVTVQLQTSSGVDADVVPSFHLQSIGDSNTEDSYVALWDWETRKPLKAGTTVSTAGIEQKKPLEINIGSLLWKAQKSSLLPHEALRSVVPKGKYRLWLDINNSKGRLLCSSNQVQIEVR